MILKAIAISIPLRARKSTGFAFAIVKSKRVIAEREAIQKIHETMENLIAKNKAKRLKSTTFANVKLEGRQLYGEQYGKE